MIEVVFTTNTKIDKKINTMLIPVAVNCKASDSSDGGVLNAVSTHWLPDLGMQLCNTEVPIFTDNVSFKLINKNAVRVYDTAFKSNILQANNSLLTYLML